jgi:hypothetical protein
MRQPTEKWDPIRFCENQEGDRKQESCVDRGVRKEGACCYVSEQDFDGRKAC